MKTTCAIAFAAAAALALGGTTGSARQSASQAGAARTASGKIRIGVAPCPAVDIVPLDSHLAMQLQAEAQQKQCEYVLFSNVTLKAADAILTEVTKK